MKILHNYCSNNENYKHLCRRCLKTHGDQTQLKEHMLRSFEQELCRISYMHRNRKIKFND